MNEAINKAKTALQKKEAAQVSPQQAQYRKIEVMLKKMETAISQALPKHITPERIGRIALTAIRRNPKLLACSEVSLLGAVLQGAQLGLEVNTPLGHAYLVPYKGQVEFQVGYRGYIELFYRSPRCVNIMAHEVCENDYFEREYGLDPKLIHRPALENRGAVVRYYAVAKLKDGGFAFIDMSRDDVINHAKRYSTSYGSSSSPWKTSFDEMAKKTCIRKIMKYLPLTTELRDAEASDNRRIDINLDAEGPDDLIDLSTDDYVENDEFVEEEKQGFDLE